MQIRLKCSFATAFMHVWDCVRVAFCDYWADWSTETLTLIVPRQHELIWMLTLRIILKSAWTCVDYNAHTHTRLMALCPGLPGWAGTRMVKPIWILLEQETVSGSGINWAICKSAPRFRQITTPAPQHSVFYRPDALPVAQPTASKHWRLLCGL